ncbi:MAG: hypothetical protein JWN98_1888 [Abditibacteriota bacterium]|nr:hypothetical protein [Abditibacteriota bacterium]
MSSKIQFLSYSLSLLLGVAGVFATGARCDTPPAATTTVRLDLTKQGALQTKVTVEAKRQPINDFLAALTAQSQVVLKVPPELPVAAARITAHLEEFALADAMLCIERLYNMRWSRLSEREWILNHVVGSDLDRDLGKLGDIKWFSWRQGSVESRSEDGQVNWTAKVLANFDEERLRQKKGVPFGELPEDVQQGIRRRFERRARLQLVKGYARARVFSIEPHPLDVSSKLFGDINEARAAGLNVSAGIKPVTGIVVVAHATDTGQDFTLNLKPQLPETPRAAQDNAAAK